MSEKLYTQEDIDKAYDTGLNNGKGEKHQKPSPETIKMIDEINEKLIKNDQEHLNIRSDLKELKDMMIEDRDNFKPILENYKATTKIGKWIFALLSFLALLFGVIISWTKICDIFKFWK
jgi:hypothetical protein